MNRIYLLFVLALLSIAGNCQELDQQNAYRFNFKGGAGYFHCLPAGSNGTTIWVEGSMKLKTGFDFSLKLQHSQANMTLGDDWGPLQGQKKPDIFYVVDITFSRPFQIGKKHFVDPGIGFMFEKSYSWLPPLEFINGNAFLVERFGTSMEDLGLSFRVDYRYQTQRGFFMGARAQSYYILGCFVEGLAITPVFGVRF